MGLRTTEIDGIPRERSLIIDSLLQTLLTDGVSMKKMSQELSLPVDEVSSLLFGLGIVKSNNQTNKYSPSNISKPKLNLVE